MSRSSFVVVALLAGLTGGCALYNEVDVTPLVLLPANIERGTDIDSMLAMADYLRAMELGAVFDARQRASAAELAGLGRAYMAAGRYPEARTRLRAALDLAPFRTTYAQIAWDLSQVEYMSNNYEPSLEWALIAQERGLRIRQWHLDYVKSLAAVPVYRFSGEPSASLPLTFGRPEVPRVRARLNRVHEAEAIIDSGAVLSIISQRLADSLKVKSLGTFEGTFYGLLGEPIQVRFALLETLELGSLVIENVPVAIMPDEKMRFLISKGEQQIFRMDFLLGSNLLKEFRLELDFNGPRAVFTRLFERDRHPAADQNIFFAGFRPHVRGAVNRRGWFLFIIDTGSEITFLNESRVASLPVQSFGAGAHTAMLQGLGGAMKHGSKLENVELGLDKWGGRFKTLPMYWAEEKEHAVGIIGQNFLKNFNVVIDFGRMRVDLKRR
jgi:tetratricopeptide (TPR) repeat protein